MENFSTAGYMGDKSPDRADAMVRALTNLMVEEGDFDMGVYVKAFGPGSQGLFQMTRRYGAR